MTSTYNRAHLLGQAIESVLAQTFADFEHIIIDDGSQDDTRAIVARFTDPRVRYVFQENAGLAAGRNAGIRHARGNYVTFLDDDDLYVPGNLVAQYSFLEGHPEVGWSSGGFRTTDMQGRVLDELKPWQAFPDLSVRTWLFSCPTCPSAVMVKKAWIEKIGGFDTQYGTTDDWDAWLRLAQAGCKMSWVEVLACQYRLHDSNMIREVAGISKKRFAMLDRFYAGTTIASDLRELQQQVYAQAYLEEGLREYGAGLTSEGQSDLGQAIALAPDLLIESGRAIVNVISGYAAGPPVTDPVSYINAVFSNLPTSAETLIGQRRKTIGQAAMARFFQAGRLSNAAVVRQMFLVALRHDPSWLRNRGVWSILVKALLQLDGI